MLGFLKRLLGNAPSAPPAQIGTSKPSLPSSLPVTVELTVTSSSRPHDVFNVGALTETQRGWVLNPKSTFPLTVYGITREQASELKKLLDQPSMNYYEGRRSYPPPSGAGQGVYARNQFTRPGNLGLEAVLGPAVRGGKNSP